MATLHIIDTRQHRTDQPCLDRFPAVESLCNASPRGGPDATLTGTVQEQWLYEGLRENTAIWNVIAQQVMLMEWDATLINALGAAYNADAWDGYPTVRRRLLDFLAAQRPNNPVVLSGDIHSAWAGDLKADFNDQDSETLGTEFVCSGITSTFLGMLLPLVKLTLARNNPHIRYFEGTHRGYCVCEVDRARWRTHFQGVQGAGDGILAVPRADLPVETIATWSIKAGSPGLIRE